MQISTKDWKRYIDRLAAVNQAAADQMQEYIRKNGFGDTDAIIRMAHALSTKYGEAAAAATCDMYEAIADAQGVTVRSAEPARTPTLEEASNVIRSALERAPSTVPDETGKLVKKTSTRTMRKNAARDGAQMALIPSGDGCAFCKMLASRGWESARSSKSFEAHLHKHCRCEYVVRFGDDLEVEGYDPDALYDEFMQFDGSWDEKMQAMRREHYASNKDTINAQKRAAYAKRKSSQDSIANTKKGAIINNNKGKLQMDLQFFAEKDIKNQESNSLKRAIRKYKARIAEHEGYIKNPEAHVPDWDNLSENRRKGLIRHWEKEIRNFNKSIDDRITELKERGDYDE